MFLRRLYIKNLRGISELDLSFAYEGPTDLDAESSSRRQLEGDARKWTLILGENGCGKSTVLRAVALILAGSDAARGVASRAGHVDSRGVSRL